MTEGWRKHQFETTPAMSRRMSRQASRDTAIEVRIRSELHRRGLRFRIHQRPMPGLRREADIVFRGAKVAVFVDGCFWHGCPSHGHQPAKNTAYWTPKLARNVQRDRQTDAALEAAGWLPVRVWEHQPPEEAALEIEEAVRTRLARGG